MRHIQKGNEPRDLGEWRTRCMKGPNFNYDSIDAELRRNIRQALVAEQRGLCAYTGRWINDTMCHIEHLKPRAHCEKGEDVFYGNMVACVPAPNTARLPYGAHQKGSWPDPTQEGLFVSPLRPECETRFTYTSRGEMKPARQDDIAAAETIHRLGLNNDRLRQLREAAIEETVEFSGDASASLRNARTLLAQINRAEQGYGPLRPFTFVLKPILEKEIQRLEAIRNGRRG